MLDNVTEGRYTKNCSRRNLAQIKVEKLVRIWSTWDPRRPLKYLGPSTLRKLTSCVIGAHCSTCNVTSKLSDVGAFDDEISASGWVLSGMLKLTGIYYSVYFVQASEHAFLNAGKFSIMKALDAQNINVSSRLANIETKILLYERTWASLLARRHPSAGCRGNRWKLFAAAVRSIQCVETTALSAADTLWGMMKAIVL